LGLEDVAVEAASGIFSVYHRKLGIVKGDLL
jgi:hypothetical protein